VKFPRFRRIKNDLRTGWAVMRQGSADAVNRSLEEVELLRLKFKVNAIEREIDDLLTAAGERAFQLMERDEAANLRTDKEMVRLFDKVELLKEEESRIRFEMNQVRE